LQILKRERKNSKRRISSPHTKFRGFEEEWGSKFAPLGEEKKEEGEGSYNSVEKRKGKVILA